MLRGLNKHRDLLYLVLDCVGRTYTLSESTLPAGQHQRLPIHHQHPIRTVMLSLSKHDGRFCTIPGYQLLLIPR